MPVFVVFSAACCVCTRICSGLALALVFSFLPSFLPSFLHSFLPSFLPSFLLPSFLPSFLPSLLSFFLSFFLCCFTGPQPLAPALPGRMLIHDYLHGQRLPICPPHMAAESRAAHHLLTASTFACWTVLALSFAVVTAVRQPFNPAAAYV